MAAKPVGPTSARAARLSPRGISTDGDHAPPRARASTHASTHAALHDEHATHDHSTPLRPALNYDDQAAARWRGLLRHLPQRRPLPLPLAAQRLWRGCVRYVVRARHAARAIEFSVHATPPALRHTRRRADERAAHRWRRIISSTRSTLHATATTSLLRVLRARASSRRSLSAWVDAHVRRAQMRGVLHRWQTALGDRASGPVQLDRTSLDLVQLFMDHTRTRISRTVPSSELHGDPPFTAAGRARPAGAARDYLRAWSAAAESSRRDRVRGMTNEHLADLHRISITFNVWRNYARGTDYMFAGTPPPTASSRVSQHNADTPLGNVRAGRGWHATAQPTEEAHDVLADYVLAGRHPLGLTSPAKRLVVPIAPTLTHRCRSSSATAQPTMVLATLHHLSYWRKWCALRRAAQASLAVAVAHHRRCNACRPSSPPVPAAVPSKPPNRMASDGAVSGSPSLDRDVPHNSWPHNPSSPLALHALAPCGQDAPDPTPFATACRAALTTSLSASQTASVRIVAQSTIEPSTGLDNTRHPSRLRKPTVPQLPPPAPTTYYRATAYYAWLLRLARFMQMASFSSGIVDFVWHHAKGLAHATGGGTPPVFSVGAREDAELAQLITTEAGMDSNTEAKLPHHVRYTSSGTAMLTAISSVVGAASDDTVALDKEACLKPTPIPTEDKAFARLSAWIDELEVVELSGERFTRRDGVKSIRKLFSSLEPLTTMIDDLERNMLIYGVRSMDTPDAQLNAPLIIRHSLPLLQKWTAAAAHGHSSSALAVKSQPKGGCWRWEDTGECALQGGQCRLTHDPLKKGINKSKAMSTDGSERLCPWILRDKPCPHAACKRHMENFVHDASALE